MFDDRLDVWKLLWSYCHSGIPVWSWLSYCGYEGRMATSLHESTCLVSSFHLDFRCLWTVLIKPSDHLGIPSNFRDRLHVAKSLALHNVPPLLPFECESNILPLCYRICRLLVSCGHLCRHISVFVSNGSHFTPYSRWLIDMLAPSTQLGIRRLRLSIALICKPLL